MIKAKRDGQDMHFDNMEEVLVFLVENMVLRSEADETTATLRAEIREVRTELKGDIGSLRTDLKSDMASLEHRLKDHIDTGLADVKRTTAPLLREKGIISKSEGLEYIRATA